RIEVRDTGPGIAAEHLPHLFEPFYRVDKSRSHEAGHMGLGLALVKAHVAALRGTLRVESEVGKGTTFYLTISRTARPDHSP
ncbi:MAG TPA: sensor histidine kinase, partial [Tepidisphaeraceae bacterium]|nr:sensor histidine kinase [Tepidisphaeraceae bacterium]